MVSRRLEGQPKRVVTWLGKQVICRDDSELGGYEERILLAIYGLGYRSFREFLLAHTTDSKGEAWSLTEQAEALDIPQTPYIRYHTRWVEQNAPKGAIQ